MKLPSHVPAIILAGGFGTRLRHIVQDVPKPMAPINGRPFLEILLDYLRDEGIQRVILATGHQAEVISQHFGDSYNGISIEYSHEEEPLGTGGAIKQAFERFQLSEAFVLNGDTFFPVSLARQYYFHEQWNADVTLAVKYLTDFDRYGTLTWNAFNRIEGFNEKMKQKEGWINGGIYLLNKSIFLAEFPTTFSFENSVLETHCNSHHIYALPSSAYFVDFGVPEDYARFQLEINSLESIINKHLHTLFIDRDGVINDRIPGDYVRQPDQFTFLPGVVNAMKKLRNLYDLIVVVTNQQGIGKGLMTPDNLESVHTHMLELLTAEGVALDCVLHCPKLAIDHPACRKPNVGMAFEAKFTLADIDWSACTLIGDSTSDIEFGLRVGMNTILVGDKSQTELSHQRFEDLSDYAASLDG